MARGDQPASSSIIKNFGFMWEREKVRWGSRGPGGKAVFMGTMVGNKKRQVDFLGQVGIYVLYDRFEQPVQVGQAKNIFSHLRQHRRDHLRNRWVSFTWFGFYKVGAQNTLLVRDQATELRRPISLGNALNEIEAVLIQVLEPRLNRRGSNWNDTEGYLQFVDEADEEEDESEEA